VKAIPAGGYVKIAGMNPLEDDVPAGDEDRAYYAKPIWQRALVILAGPMSHFLVAMLIFSSLLFFFGQTGEVSLVGEVSKTIAGVDSPAYVAGIRPGDIIVGIDGVANPDWEQLGTVLADHVGDPIDLVILRGDERIAMTLTPVVDTIDGEKVPRLGIVLGPQPQPFFTSIGGGAKEVWVLTGESFRNIGKVFGPSGIARTFGTLFSNEPRDPTSAQSFVGVGGTFGSLGAAGEWANFLFLFGYVTLFIGLVNLIPLPPFDGGHLAVLLIEKIRGRRVDMRKLIPVSAVVLTFLVLFTVATVALDLTKPIPTTP
jgi:membrane-associated protease RseP (regulator of RpoE activity)